MIYSAPAQAFDHVKRTAFLPRFLCVLCLMPLFFISLGSNHSQWKAELLDAAHVPFFFLVGILIFPSVKLPYRQRLIVLLVVIAVASLMIEGAQDLVGRQFELIDVYRNLLGFGLGACLVAFRSSPFYLTKVKSSCVFLVFLTLALIERAPLIGHTASQIYMFNNAPVLANFHHDFELLNWYPKNASVAIEEDALLVNLTANKKSTGVDFKNFPSDWSGFDHVVLKLENTSLQPVKLYVSIRDKMNQLNKKSNNREYKNIVLEPGVNTLRLNIAGADEYNAPHGLDLEKVNTLHLRSYNTETGLKIHSVALEHSLLASR